MTVALHVNHGRDALKGGADVLLVGMRVSDGQGLDKATMAGQEVLGNMSLGDAGSGAGYEQ
jgi:hypothetical protein